MKTQFTSFVLGLSLFAMLASSARSQTAAPPRKAAIFVDNRGGTALDDKVAVLEDLLGSRIAGRGFQIIHREQVINALKNYEKRATDATPGSQLDQLLSNNTSALRLAQMMNADYIIHATITSFATEKRVFKGYGAETLNMISNLRVTYKVLEATEGSSLAGDAFTVSRTTRLTEGSATDNADLLNSLLDDATVKIADSLGQKTIAAAPAKPGMVEFTVTCTMQDIAQMPITVPDVRLTTNKTLVLDKATLEVQPLDVTVELDGTALGSAPGSFKAMPGLHKMRLSRDGFKDWEKTVNVTEGQKFRVALQMTEAGYQRWQDNLKFLQGLENNRKLTDAEVERIQGDAQRLRQSGYKVDIKMDTKEGINVNQQFQSLFSQMPMPVPAPKAATPLPAPAP